MSAILEARGLSKRFGGFAALTEVDLAVAEGTIHAVIGPNGAGKTTLFNVLAGMLPPSAGSITYRGARLDRVPAHRRVGLGMARSFQVTSLFQDLSVAENLRLAAQARQPRDALRPWRRADQLPGPRAGARAVLERLELGALAEAKAGDLSHGQQRLLEVGLAMAAQPRLYFLDEPTSGMGVDDIGTIKRLIRELVRRDGATVLLIEHNMDIVMDISDRLTVLQQGRVLAEGTPAEMRVDPAVRAAYLGEPL